MDTFVDSSWYFMRYCSPDAADRMVDERNDYWMPMDQYIGGIEHAVLHLLYARFWTKVMRDLGLVKFDEPFTRLFTQGMLTHDCYFREDDEGRKRWFYPNEIDIEYDDKGRPVKAIAREDGGPVAYGGTEKMSKSKNNVVEPRDIIGRFGADTARAFVMFAGPPDQSAAWSNSGAEGTYRFLRRLWSFGYARRDAVAQAGAVDPASLAAPLKAVRREIHLNLRQADFDYERVQYNTVVSAAMKMLNALDDARLGDTPAERALAREGLGILLRVLYPIAPHVTHALWQALGFAQALGDLLDAPWPAADDEALRQDEIELVVQVNGKLRGAIRVPAAADRQAIEQAALADPAVRKFVGDGTVRRVVVVPNKLVNVVV
jgi:leucyl-tRNA synthetase